MGNKDNFVEILRRCAYRPGIENIIGWLEETGFFEAPASTKYHGAYPGGLLKHSLNVYSRLMRKRADFPEGTTAETIAIISLLHDVCKADIYKAEETLYSEGQKTVRYGYDNNLPIGHGEKSVILIQRHMQLTDEEIVAISWHVGTFDARVQGGSKELSQVWERYPLAFLLHIADMEATWLDERRATDVPEK